MRKYELFCLLKSSFDIENTDQAISTIEKSIGTLGGNILETNKAGRKKLAYDIGRQRDAFCVTFIMEISPDKIKELKRNLKLNETVVREYITLLNTNKKAVPA